MTSPPTSVTTRPVAEAHLVFRLELAVLPARWPEELEQLLDTTTVFRLRPSATVRATLADVRDLTLEVPDAGLVRVRLDELRSSPRR